MKKYWIRKDTFYLVVNEDDDRVYYISHDREGATHFSDKSKADFMLKYLSDRFLTNDYEVEEMNTLSFFTEGL